MRTAAQEAASQIALRDCSKAAVGGEVQEEGNIYIFMADLDVVKLLASRDQMANIR